MPISIFCRNCNVLVMVLYNHIDSVEYQIEEYCSEYCFTAIESPEDLKYFKKPKWVK